ncbi:MAG: HNH endonuclease [Alphaproteobacteria bacterium]|nr:HNH endonuclease [Alphaproteobacteria bacterium]
MCGIVHDTSRLGGTIMREMRRCRKCGELKPLTTEFYNQLSTDSWRGSCKACMAANTKRNYYKNPAAVIARVKKYKSLKSQAGGAMTDAETHTMRHRQGDRCGYCDTKLNGAGEFDHMIPVRLGGNSAASNMILACLECNRDKHGKTAEKFVAWRRRLGRNVREDT